ncbi:ATP-binding protein [Streptomyces arenae]|uniref:ATP-binding protein n=1 Tax=Streptomyces arenae TaxID=29301 RepID=UPI0026584B47|nr:ATP-binding protein [Streptomyces arenae]MCG7207241.1 ATP-binding protein [Streptomyces arenae]
MCTALAQPGGSLEDMCSRVMRGLPGHAPADDVTLLLARTRALDPPQVASWDLPNEPVSVPTARHLAARQLREWGLETLVAPVETIVSELVTNAIRHGPSRLRLIQHRVLTCEVSDSNTGRPRPRRPHTLDEHGRGLHLVGPALAPMGLPLRDGRQGRLGRTGPAPHERARRAAAERGDRQRPSTHAPVAAGSDKKAGDTTTQ